MAGEVGRTTVSSGPVSDVAHFLIESNRVIQKHKVPERHRDRAIAIASTDGHRIRRRCGCLHPAFARRLSLTIILNWQTSQPTTHKHLNLMANI